MKIPGIRFKLSGTLLCLMLFAGISNGQAYRFRHYNTDNNLPDNVVYTVNQDNNGYLWVGTPQGLARFDGFQFHVVVFPDSSARRYPTVSLKDKKGTLWFGFDDGSVFYSDNGLLKPTGLQNTSGISALIEGDDGLIYVIPQRKAVFSIDPGKPETIVTYTLGGDPFMFSACFYGKGKLLVGTQENLLVCELINESVVTKMTVEGFDYSRVMAVYKMNDNNSFIIGTDGNGLFRLDLSDENYSLSRFDNHPELETIAVTSITKDSGNHVWISTAGTGAFKIIFDMEGSRELQSVQHLNQTSGLAGDNLSIMFQDFEDNFWIGYNGDGLSMLSSDALSFHVPGDDNGQNNIIYVNRLKEKYFLGTPTGYYLFGINTGTTERFVELTPAKIGSEVNSYLVDGNDIWIGTKGSGLYLCNDAGTTRLFHRSGDTGADYISGIAADGDNIWLSTLNGVIIISKKTRLPLKSFNMDNGLPHNSINQVLLDKNGRGYVATESEKLFWIDPDSGIFSSDAIMYGILLNKIQALSQGRDKVIWASTQGNGIFGVSGDSIRSVTVADGLLSNYTYSILADSMNNIWIGHERGFSRFNPASGMTRVFGTDFARSGSCNPSGMYESADGKIFIGTTEGLIIYDSAKDRKKQTAPFCNINSVTINDVTYPYQPSFSLPYNKRYTVTVSYAGINFSNPGRVYYSTYLENYDDDWTEASTTREVKYSLRDGKYRFNLISVNEDGLSQEVPVSFIISIRPPFWRTWWFILSSIALFAGAVVIIIREREKAQKKLQVYLEKELEARTLTVMKQKDELESQNLEITDSINYARRIQSSILPDIHRLKEQFSDAFVLLYPRDIVSGDFYWFDRLDDDRFVLVCADSTGHGVPGAFMSMIGTTLLQDIVTRQRISRPSEILTMLDKQIFATLNQNLEVGVSNDGMDVVVCEFTLSNRHLRFASAMRPVILVMGGETYYIKGNRASVGGQSVIEKYFDDQEYYLHDGDTLYMFSDGLPDQFGGPDGKKMKIARLKRLISEVAELPVDKQKEAIEDFYRQWKGNFEQVDDILIMGVKI